VAACALYDSGVETGLWTAVGFAALPLGAYEAVYLQEDGTLSRLPILGVLLEEEVTLSGAAGILRTGNTRAGMAHQAEPGGADLEIAGGDVGFVGVYPAGVDPLPEFLGRARVRLAQRAPGSD
jgi:hypothetical protein